MAIDGSFRLENELKRFIYRCPKLNSVPIFQQLIKKGDRVSEDEVVNAVGQVVLHPNYTIPLLGCFRPIARNIVDRAVSILHLEIGPDLRDSSDDCMIEFEEDNLPREDDDDTDMEQVVSLVDNYVRLGKRLNLHEVACLAFCRALDLIPSLLGSVLSYFARAPPPFVRIKPREHKSDALDMGGKGLLNVARISYRFLLAKPDFFSTLWDWSCFMHLTRVDDVETKWCAVQIILEVFNSSDSLIEKFGLDSQQAFNCLSRWKEFISDVSLEKASWYIEPSALPKTDSVLGQINCDQGFTLQPCSLASSADRSVLPSLTNDQLTSSSGRPFVLTSAVNKSYEMVFVAVTQRWPVLLYGPAGSGKTALVKKLGQSNGRPGISSEHG
ncbi:hypothetical protein LIER_02317 [Lithospermum erythrorhizon]|uniref:Midasin n=1 Tax=Lithospermum erythrorhizon TaxID=34254 RepID=A0AAV3NTL3_LITER